MTDLAITAANVVSGSNADVDRTGNAGATIAQGQTVYQDATTKKWLLADSNSATLLAQTAKGIALNAASNNQPLAVQKHGDITIGATLVAGASYYLSETPGGIEPAADQGAGENVCLLGIAKSTTVLALDIQTPGVTL